MAADRIQTTIRFREDTLRKISYVAKKNCRSLNEQLEFLALGCIEEYENSKNVSVNFFPENEKNNA